jgi:hypothetical protein
MPHRFEKVGLPGLRDAVRLERKKVFLVIPLSLFGDGVFFSALFGLEHGLGMNELKSH